MSAEEYRRTHNISDEPEELTAEHRIWEGVERYSAWKEMQDEHASHDGELNADRFTRIAVADFEDVEGFDGHNNFDDAGSMGNNLSALPVRGHEGKEDFDDNSDDKMEGASSRPSDPPS
jgi:hypothetical protein